MAAAEVRAALSRPAAPPELWRERRFEIVLEEGWISGCFDRVTIGRDSAGRATAAEILDYKSNRVSTDEEVRAAAESYRPQMELYRRALSRMLGLAAERIGLHLIFTAPGRVVTLPAKQGT
jgi:ATP-dependent exoDNAse (exonuclease V) beta subunit